MANVDDEWFSLDLESKINKKIDSLQDLVHQQTGELHFVQHASACQHLSSQNDRTHQLLEELKIIKQREVNLMLREKIPIPFFPSNSSPIPTPFSIKRREETKIAL